jgi:CBS domain-containing protein
MKSTVIAGVLWAAVRMAETLGYPLPVDDEIVDGLAVGIISAVNLVFALTTSKTVGVADAVLPTASNGEK